MDLEIQIQSLIFSLVFGMFFSLIFNLMYKHLFRGKKVFRLFTNMLFVIFNVLLYFGILSIINDGIIHTYFMLMVVVGFIIGNKKTKKIRKYRLEIFEEI